MKIINYNRPERARQPDPPLEEATAQDTELGICSEDSSS